MLPVRFAMRSSILALVSLSFIACRSSALDGADLPERGQPTCATLADPARCAADPDCHWEGCPDGHGGWSTGSGCWPKNGPVHTTGCATPDCGPPPPPVSTCTDFRDEQSCASSQIPGGCY